MEHSSFAVLFSGNIEGLGERHGSGLWLEGLSLEGLYVSPVLSRDYIRGGPQKEGILCTE